MKRITKNLVCLALCTILMLSDVTAVFAGTTTYTRAGSATGTGTVVKNAKVTIRATTNMTAHINWVAVGHWVRSVGTSVATTTPVTGYTYSIVTNAHTIRAKVQGLIVDLSFTSGTKLVGSGSDKTYYCNTAAWSYQIEGECTSLVGYNEWHSIDYVVKDTKNMKPVETISVTKKISLY